MNDSSNTPDNVVDFFSDSDHVEVKIMKPFQRLDKFIKIKPDNDDALQFWRNAFTKIENAQPNSFEKINLENLNISYQDYKKRIFKTKHIDLHGFTLEEANNKIEKFIEESYENGVTKIIVVTGKGLHSSNEKDPYVSKDLSILKYSVPEFIENHIELMKKIIEIKDAKVEDGGSGAFYIFLKKKL